MTIRYIFNTSGDYIGFFQGNNLFSRNSQWLGFIDNGNEVYGTNGAFMGYVSADDRIVKRLNEFKMNRLAPLRPLPPLPPLPPLKRLRMFPVPYPLIDVFESNAVQSVSSQPFVKSRIKGEFKGWSGNTEYELDNGQIWKQARYKYTYHYKYRPQVSIWKQNNAFFMEVHNFPEKIQVKKIR